MIGSNNTLRPMGAPPPNPNSLAPPPNPNQFAPPPNPAMMMKPAPAPSQMQT